MIKIQDIVIPTKGTAKYFNLLVLNFSPNPISVSLYWSIHEETTQEMPEGIQTLYAAGRLLLEGNLQMSQSVYDNWGTDDEYVIDWALNELGFTKVTE